MEVFLTVILILVLLFWLAGRVFPLLLGLWIKRKVNKFNNLNNQSTSPGEQQSKNKIVDKNVGEYVDFVETKDEN
ncbi:MAG: hypothetical protein VB022_01630 [Rikenellaceae bacterium]|nr:hypothetical protein [Rikenellaceae bacterium]